MPSDNDTLQTTLATQAELADIRTRILAGERVPVTDIRRLMDNLRRDRDSASRAAAKARREVKKANTQPAFTLDTLFPGQGQ